MGIQSPFQTALPTSPNLPSESVEGGLNLNQFVASLRRKLILILSVAVAVTAAAGVKSFTDTPTYVGEFEVLVQPTSAETTVISTVPGTLTGEQAGQVVNADLLKILTSSRVLQPAIEQLQAKYSDETYGSIMRSLSIAPLSKDSNIIQVGFRDPDPQKVQVVLDTVSKAYLAYSLESRQADIRLGLDFVEDKLPDLEKSVNVLQEELQQLRQRNALIDPDSRGEQLSGQVTAFSQQQLDVQVQFAQVRREYANLRSQLNGQPNEAAASAALSQNPRYQSLLGELQSIDGQIAEAATLYLETSPEMQSLREQRQNLLALVARESEQTQREIVSQLRSLEAREQALSRTVQSLNNNVNQLSGVSREYTDIQRDLQIATANLSQFLAKREALQIDVAQRQVPWELLTPPTRPAPTTTSLANNLAVGAILGLLLGVGVALLLDRFTDVIYSADEIKRITKLPLLGTIPINEEFGQATETAEAVELQEVGVGAVTTRRSSGDSRSGSRPYKSMPFFEAFRSLYTNLRPLSSDTAIRSIVISSILPDEGKSTTAAFLAQAAAALGQRVLLVDTDLRKPKLHEYLSLENTKGLTGVLSNAVSLQEAIQRSPLEPNLFVLTAGATPPDATRSLSSHKMKQLIDQVQNSYDLVIYDMPPLLEFADVYLMASKTNGIILVAELGRLKRSLVDQAFEQLKVSNTPILGVVLQRAMLSR